MQEIEQIYRNNFGIAFFWKQGDSRKKGKIQLVFRDTGFYLSKNDLQEFADQAYLTSQMNCCEHCATPNDCRTLLLKTPSAKVDMAVSKTELEQIQDLISGTLFQLDLNNYLDDLCKN